MLLSRLHSLQANAMSGPSDARYASLADTQWYAFCPSSSQELHSAWRRLVSSVDTPPGVQPLPLPVLRVW